MQSYWKKFDRVERENRRRQEKEAEEQRKMDVEFMEVVLRDGIFFYRFLFDHWPIDVS